MRIGLFTVILALLLSIVTAPADKPTVIKDPEAIQYISKEVEVRGRVVSVTTSPLGTTFINFGGEYPNQKFAGFIATRIVQASLDIVPDRFGFVCQDHHRGILPLVITLGLSSLVNAETDHKTALRSTDLGLVKCVETEERMALPGPDRVKELFLELAPTGRGHDDSSKRPIEKAPESRGNKDCRCLARTIAGGQGRRMAGLNVAKGCPLPRVRMNSKNGLSEL
jgi:hypothetical protein